MPLTETRSRIQRGGYAGLRCTIAEYDALPEDQNRYELIDGVIVMSPCPSTRHQRVARASFRQLDRFVEDRNLGEVYYETDFRLPPHVGKGDLAYRPDVLFIAADRVDQIGDRLSIVPDVVVEIVSKRTRNLDTVTKFADYQAAGVREYWLIDPGKDRMAFYRLSGNRFVEVPAERDSYASEVVPGFRLDLTKVRAAYRRLSQS